jgi:hypothetical protein
MPLHVRDDDINSTATRQQAGSYAFFHYDSSAALAREEGELHGADGWRQPYEIVDYASGSEFIRAATTCARARTRADNTDAGHGTRDGTAAGALYLSAPVDRFPLLSADVQPSLPARTAGSASAAGSAATANGSDASADAPTPTPPPRKANLWLSTPGAFARPHFDASANLFVQVRGRKRWALAPPSRWPDVRLHSQLHPANRQSQLASLREITAPPAPLGTAAAAPAEGGLFTVTLGPADALYLPPFYFHEAEAVGAGLSLSANVYLPHADALAAGSIYRIKVPLHSLPSGSSFQAPTGEGGEGEAAALVTATALDRATTRFLRTVFKHAFAEAEGPQGPGAASSPGSEGSGGEEGGSGRRFRAFVRALLASRWGGGGGEGGGRGKGSGGKGLGMGTGFGDGGRGSKQEPDILLPRWRQRLHREWPARLPKGCCAGAGSDGSRPRPRPSSSRQDPSTSAAPHGAIGAGAGREYAGREDADEAEDEAEDFLAEDDNESGDGGMTDEEEGEGRGGGSGWAWSEQLAAAAREVGAALRSMSQPAAREIALADYVELVLHQVVGKGAHVPRFLQAMACECS